MKAFKKVILVTLIISMLISSSVFAAQTFPDVDATNANQEAIEVLAALGLLKGRDDGNFAPDDTITRAEIAALVIRAKGLDAVVSSSSGATGFSDVAEDHWAAKYIEVAKSQGIISGFPDGTFKPDDKITYEQVIKTLVEATGHGPEALNNGAYPLGYIFVATRESITDGIGSVVFSNEAPRGHVAQMTFNAVTDVDLMEARTIGANGEVTYVPLEGQTMMTNYLNVQKGEGLITGYGATKLYPSVVNFNSDEAVIGGMVLKVGELDLTEFVGSQVDFYYKATNSANTLLYVRVDEDQNIIQVTPETKGEIRNLGSSSCKYSYYESTDENARLKEIAVAERATIVYNNASPDLNELTKDDFDISQGSITWFDTDGNNIYDLAIIKSYKSYGVATVVKSDMSLILKPNADNRKTISLYEAANNSAYRFSVLYNDTQASFNDIKANNVISIAESKDGMAIEVIVSAEKASGTVSEVSKNSYGRDEYKIGETKYMAAKQCDSDLKLGLEATFYLAYDGQIAYVEAPTLDLSKYGFLLKALYSNSFENSGLCIEVLTMNNERKVFYANKELQHNGVKISDTELLSKYLTTKEGYTNRDLISYTVDGKGKLTALNTRVILSEKDANGNLPTINYENPVTFDYMVTDSDQTTPKTELPYNLIYRPGDAISNFKGLFQLNNATARIVSIPVSYGEMKSVSDTSKFKIISVSEWTYEWNKDYLVIPYNITDGFCPMLMLFGANTVVSPSSPFFIFDTYSEVIVGQDELDSIRVSGYRSNKKVTFDVDPLGAEYDNIMRTFKSARKGDVFFISLNADNQVAGIRYALSATFLANTGAKNMTEMGKVGGNENSGEESMLGRVVNFNMDQMVVESRVSGAANMEGTIGAKVKPLSPLPANIVMVEIRNIDTPQETRQLKLVASGIIETGDFTVHRSIYDGVQEMYVIRVVS